MCKSLIRHANISVTLDIYAQAISQTKRDAQSRVVSLLIDKNEEQPSTDAYRTVTNLQTSGGDLHSSLNAATRCSRDEAAHEGRF